VPAGPRAQPASFHPSEQVAKLMDEVFAMVGLDAVKREGVDIYTHVTKDLLMAPAACPSPSTSCSSATRARARPRWRVFGPLHAMWARATRFEDVSGPAW
jgi:hypothetical protein